MRLDSALSWPFFTDAHRDRARLLERWLEGIPAERFVADAESGADAGERVRSWARDLGSAGWLEPCARLDVRALALAREQLAYHGALADFAFAMQGLGSGAISLFGDQHQRERTLPAIFSGRSIAAFALSEERAGSDVSALETIARPVADGYELSGEKTWISNAGIADTYVVFARTSPHPSRGLSAFVVDGASAGLTLECSIQTISPHPLGTLRFDGVRVAADARLGGEGDGFRIAMSTLDVFRSTVGAAALGFARRAFDEARAHAMRREIYGKKLADLQIVAGMLAEMATEIDAAALLVYRAAFTKDSGASRITKEAAMAKWFATEAAGRVCDRAVQIFGGRGVTRGEIVERLYRDVRALRIYEGASEVQQTVIARSIFKEPSLG
ncbi:MAG: acyl-CoA dehydrogenase family protein [Candidatus Baltobacteraceae bacterium]